MPVPKRLLFAVLATVLGAGILAGCWPSVGNGFGDPGPFDEVSVLEGAEHTYYYPTDLGTGGRRHPVILWGNGTFLNPTHYDALLRHLASHGFIVAAANTSSAGNGQAILAGLDNLTAFDAQPDSPFFGHVDLTRVGATGHSQGGAGALAAGRDARVDTVAPLEPAGGDGHVPSLVGPAFFMSGEADTIVVPSTVRAKYDAATVPAAYGELAGADHVQPVGDGHGFRAPVTAWFRWRLMGDTVARDHFVGPCTYCSSSIWSEFVTDGLTAASTPARAAADPAA